MKVVVCVKLVDGELNPFDACALETALQIEEAHITVLAMGPIGWQEKLKNLTRYPIGDVILLSDTAFAGSDTLATGYILSLAIQKLQPDLVLCGRQSIDGDTAQVGPCLAQLLGYELHTNVMKPGLRSVVTQMGEESLNFPAVLTIERINTLRFFSIRSKIRPIHIWNAADLQADLSRCGQKGSPTVVVKSFENNRGQRHCQWIEPETLPNLLKELQERVRRQDMEETGERLDRIYTIGEEPAAMARTAAKEVIVLPKEEPEKLAERIRALNAEAVLWPASLWGRKNAPVVAAILQTGLCADCTRLEVENGELFFYRPARGGNITAKIRCRTLPKMATVRSTEESGKIIITAGRGAVDCLEKVRECAEKSGAEFGASRGVVDQGLAPYATQIGLTGRMVAPCIYLALGISGAIQHMCAVQGAGVIIAVNPDREAPIFQYADYGICSAAEGVCEILSMETEKM